MAKLKNKIKKKLSSARNVVLKMFVCMCCPTLVTRMEVDANEYNDTDDLVVTRVYRAASFTNAVAADRMCVQGSRSATLAESQTAAGTSRRQKKLHERTWRPATPEPYAMSRERISSWNFDSENFCYSTEPGRKRHRKRGGRLRRRRP
ncbi:uncharacterized protein LOC127854964 isoform X2 [Dreissena polymorpha]|uniref:uncharacterized protein LOC127854964 isoform X2 n=1 Tax=Dreissena polymorpha TaxID=45954 RepID=UPI0022643B40|nr:uncharacterized protein LOC127854964 isoform X2 [Dreissena polymorpha]